MEYRTALQPISVITERVITRRDCTIFFLNRILEKRGCPLIRVCSLIRSNTVVGKHATEHSEIIKPRTKLK